MKQVVLSSGDIAVVDDQDYERVNKWKWQLNRNGYACRNHWNGNRYEKMYMHRFIIGTPKGYDTDHINRNKLDNRQANLRIVNRATNNYNSLPSKANTSGIKGVSWFKPAELWRAYIGGGKSRIELGYFKTKEEATVARQEAEKRIIQCA